MHLNPDKNIEVTHQVGCKAHGTYNKSPTKSFCQDFQTLSILGLIFVRFCFFLDPPKSFPFHIYCMQKKILFCQIERIDIRYYNQSLNSAEKYPKNISKPHYSSAAYCLVNSHFSNSALNYYQNGLPNLFFKLPKIYLKLIQAIEDVLWSLEQLDHPQTEQSFFSHT